MMGGDQLFEGKYRILKTLGQGGMSTVYLAENVKLGTLWAIKQINKRPDSKVDLLVEPNILKKLNHPALPRVFDIVENETHIFIIVDYIEGTSLDKELVQARRFSEKTVVDWARQICSVLEYLHNFRPNPIIYRDMKPSNIILTKDGSIKLIDFGIAREYKADSRSDTIYIGTRGYAAPEQYGAGQTNAMTDIYSLGVTLYHLATGKSPNEPPYEIKPVRYFAPELSEGFERIVAKCTRQNPEQRYQSVRELLKDLDALYSMESNKTVGKETSGGNRDISQYINFKKLILNVWGNHEFACELAYITAKITDFKVLLVNLDVLSHKIDIYLNIKSPPVEYETKETGMNELIHGIRCGQPSFELLEHACVRKRELPNLYILSRKFELNDDVKHPEEDISKLTELFYRYFDVTLLITNRSVLDVATKVCLEQSDYNIIAAQGNIDEICEYGEYLTYMEEKYGIPAGKTKYVAWEYKTGTNLPKAVLQKVFSGQSYIGHVSYDSEREAYRNLSNTFYSKWAYKKHLREYEEILTAFNIVPKVSFLEKIARLFASNKKMKQELWKFEEERNKLKQEVEKITMQAVTDPLTKVYNRAKFNQELASRIEDVRNTGENLSLVLFDIDHFKKINDSYGHDQGDAVLVKLSGIIKNSIEKKDTFARWGGEEFILLLPGTELGLAVRIAGQLRKKVVEAEFGSVGRISCSFGVSSFIHRTDDEGSFIKRADMALYAAKNAGRNCVQSC